VMFYVDGRSICSEMARQLADVSVLFPVIDWQCTHFGIALVCVVRGTIVLLTKPLRRRSVHVKRAIVCDDVHGEFSAA
jgi:hypothetical protein